MISTRASAEGEDRAIERDDRAIEGDHRAIEGVDHAIEGVDRAIERVDRAIGNSSYTVYGIPLCARARAALREAV